MDAKLAAARPDLDALTRRNALGERLEDGYQRIEEAIAEGRDVREWEDFWIQLLGEYEALVDGWPRAA
ncbi:MAG: hypothetical protein M3R06_02370 [Chloroflexota bacterium]|nr:hypothetical protein [Chloroflexota bacterium]